MSKNIIVWFEIYVKDMERAKKFYSQVLGTRFHSVDAPGNAGEMKMAFFAPPDEEGAFVNGALIEMPGTKEGDGTCVNTMVYFPCKDCAVEESRVAAAGGIVNRPKFSIGEFGFCSICVDSEGNPFGLYSMQ